MRVAKGLSLEGRKGHQIQSKSVNSACNFPFVHKVTSDADFIEECSP